jgi:hypothetical protein
MQLSPDNLTSFIALINERGKTELVPQPDHPALVGFVADIELTLNTESPRVAFSKCCESLIAISGLLELASQGDPVTLIVLASSDLTTNDLTQFGIWLDQRGEEISTSIS